MDRMDRVDSTNQQGQLNNINIIPEPTSILIFVCIYYSLVIIKRITYLIQKKVIAEQLQVSEKITTLINILYINAPQRWKEKHPGTSQKESLRDIFHTYEHMTRTCSQSVEMTIDALSILFITFTNNVLVGFFVVIGTIILFKLNQKLSINISNLDAQIKTKIDRINNDTCNQFTQRVDIMYSPLYKKLYTEDMYNPINGLVDSYKIWDDRDILSQKTKLIVNVVRVIMLVFVSLYLMYSGNIGLVIFLIINSNRIFGFSNVISYLSEVRDIAKSHVTSTFAMLDDLIELYENDAITIITDNNHNHNNNNNNLIGTINKIEINDIKKNVSDNINLSFTGKITINLEQRGVILLHGKKGCGKSVTMDLLAGLYDGVVTNGFFVNGQKISKEFKAIQNDRIYVRQCISDDYRSNKKNTITMSLTELFPNSNNNIVKLTRFLENFDIIHKLPMNNMNESISKNEKSLSPGETQVIILASQIWKTFELRIPLLLLDEPERNIDFDTIKKIFTFLESFYDGTVVLITHSENLTKFVERNIKQVWNYSSEHFCNATECSQRTLTFSISDRL